MVAVIVIAVLIYAAFHLGAGHAHHRYRKAHGQPELLLVQRARAVRQRAPTRRVPGGASPMTIRRDTCKRPRNPSGEAALPHRTRRRRGTHSPDDRRKPPCGRGRALHWRRQYAP